MTTYNTTAFTSSTLNASGSASGNIYQRNATNLLNATTETATKIGTLVTNQTQLDVKAQVSRENATNFYKFTLDGDSLKLGFQNNTETSNLRVQILNSSGKVVADSSTFGTEANQEAYALANSSDGLDLEAGDYYVKVTFDSTSLRSVPQTYSLALYSGTKFSASYQTTAQAQTSATQVPKLDDTMTFSLITAQEYSTKSTHYANETSADAINIGWIYENKSALSVFSQMTSVCKEQYYSLTLQKGDNLKMALNNRTDTSELRVQILDSSGTRILADSHGTEEQQEAYEALTSETGMEAKAGNYIIKLSYADGEPKTDQIYEMKLYSGEVYEKLYETQVATETAATAVLSGHLTDYASARTVAATYLASALDTDNDILSILKGLYS